MPNHKIGVNYSFSQLLKAFNADPQSDTDAHYLLYRGDEILGEALVRLGLFCYDFVCETGRFFLVYSHGSHPMRPGAGALNSTRSAAHMKIPIALGMVLSSALTFAATNDYPITILKPGVLAAISRPEYKASTHLVGKSIAAIFGPVSEVRVELSGVNKAAIDEDTKKVERKLRERIDRAECLGRDSELPWHNAPWMRGYILLKDGRILPIEILTSGVIVGDLLFTEKAEPDASANGSHVDPIRYSFYYNGIEREYFVWLPKDFDASQIYWGLVTVHGGGSNGRTFWLTSQIRRAADEMGLRAIVISPSFLKDDPNAQRFPVLGEGAFLKRMLEEIHGMYQLQPKILITGYSRGGQFTHRFALWNPTLVQACAPLSAGSWTTPDGRFLMLSLGEVEDPEAYLASPQKSEGLASSQKSLFDFRVAKVAGRPASSGATNVPFLVMCGSVDERFDIAKEFAGSLKKLGYVANTAWPKTPHGGREKDEYRTEFEKYSQITVEFFYRVTEEK